MESTGCFRHNAVAYQVVSDTNDHPMNVKVSHHFHSSFHQETVYLRLGTLAAMSLVHGGAAFRIFSPTVFRFLSGTDAADLIASIDEVPDPAIRIILNQVWHNRMLSSQFIKIHVFY